MGRSRSSSWRRDRSARRDDFAPRTAIRRVRSAFAASGTRRQALCSSARVTGLVRMISTACRLLITGPPSAPRRPAAVGGCGWGDVGVRTHGGRAGRRVPSPSVPDPRLLGWPRAGGSAAFASGAVRRTAEGSGRTVPSPRQAEPVARRRPLREPASRRLLGRQRRASRRCIGRVAVSGPRTGSHPGGVWRGSGRTGSGRRVWPAGRGPPAAGPQGPSVLPLG